MHPILSLGPKTDSDWAQFLFSTLRSYFVSIDVAVESQVVSWQLPVDMMYAASLDS